MLDTAKFFDFIFQNARTNAKMIIDDSGIVLQGNDAFRSAFRNTTEDLASKHFRIL